MEDLEHEVAILLRKVQASEDVVARAQAYYDNYSHQWSDGVCGWFQDVLEQKRDQIAYEWDRIGHMGDSIAAGRDYRRTDI